MKSVPSPVTIAKYLPAFVAPKSDCRELFQCIKYTGKYGIATTTITMLIFPSKVPPMIQNYYTREIFDGVFPDADKIIPTEYEYHAGLSQESVYGLIKATQCAMNFVEKREADSASMQISFANGKITVKTRTPDREMETTIKAECVGGFAINVNPAKFIPLIKCAHDFCKPGELINFDFSGENSVFVITAGDIKVVATPMRVNWRS